MPPKKTKRAKPAAGPKLPTALKALTGTLAGLGDATVVTRNIWQGGGVEVLVANGKFGGTHRLCGRGSGGSKHAAAPQAAH